MTPNPVVGAIVVALIGWFATLIAINRSSISGTWKRRFMIPSWLPWMGLALGAPILSGMIPLQQALNVGGALTTGMLVSMVMTRRPPQR
jgi:hypothetical protein